MQKEVIGRKTKSSYYMQCSNPYGLSYQNFMKGEFRSQRDKWKMVPNNCLKRYLEFNESQFISTTVSLLTRNTAVFLSMQFWPATCHLQGFAAASVSGLLFLSASDPSVFSLEMITQSVDSSPPGSISQSQRQNKYGGLIWQRPWVIFLGAHLSQDWGSPLRPRTPRILPTTSSQHTPQCPSHPAQQLCHHQNVALNVSFIFLSSMSQSQKFHSFLTSSFSNFLQPKYIPGCRDQKSKVFPVAWKVTEVTQTYRWCLWCTERRAELGSSFVCVGKVEGGQHQPKQQPWITTGQHVWLEQVLTNLGERQGGKDPKSGEEMALFPTEMAQALMAASHLQEEISQTRDDLWA